MASFSENIKWVTEPAYEDVKTLYDQVQDISAQMNCRSFDPFIHFRCGSISCTTHSAEEFVEAAYGAENFHLVAMQLRNCENNSSKNKAGKMIQREMLPN